MGRMTVTIDEKLVSRAQRALGVRTKAEAIRIALEEVLRRKKLAQALGHRGQIALDLDQETLERLRGAS